MRRIDTYPAAAREPRVGAPFRAVPVNHVPRDVARALGHMSGGGDVARPELAAHRNPAQSECEHRRERRQCRFSLSPAQRGISNHADAVAARGLSAREIDHMAKKPADRRAQDMKDFQAALGSRKHVGGWCADNDARVWNSQA